jgi:hypothetical protein
MKRGRQGSGAGVSAGVPEAGLGRSTLKQEIIASGQNVGRGPFGPTGGFSQLGGILSIRMSFLGLGRFGVG